jgi:hypothetical protein
MVSSTVVFAVGHTMRALALLLTILWTAVPSLVQAADLPTLKKGSPYASARTALRQKGYSPVRGDGSGCRFGREDVCKAYPEAETCAGTGLGNCLFVWRRGKQVIEVMTIGEEPKPLTVAGVKCRSGCR